MLLCIVLLMNNVKMNMLHVDSAKNITPPNIPSVGLNVQIVTKYYYFVWGLHII